MGAGQQEIGFNFHTGGKKHSQGKGGHNFNGRPSFDRLFLQVEMMMLIMLADKTVTAWIPLQSTPLHMGPLEFSAGSHVILEGRELQISDESEVAIQQRLRVTDFPHVIEPFVAGEISFHSGWVIHRAGAYASPGMRKVMTVIYMDKAMRLKQPENENQVADWKTWCPGPVAGEEINTPINPVLFEY